MSIAPPVGAMSSYLSRLYSGAPFQEFKQAAKGMVSLLPEPLQEGARRAKEMLKGMTVGGTLFEELGLSYIGPIETATILTSCCPVLRTVKARATGPNADPCDHQEGAKGWSPRRTLCRQGPIPPAPSSTWRRVSKAKAASNAPSYTQGLCRSVAQRSRGRQTKIVALTAAMPDGTGLDLFAKRFPKRMFDVGIAEQHAVTFAAGLAAGGMKPLLSRFYSTFLQRGYDQVVHDVAIQRLPVRFAIDRAGLVSADGAPPMPGPSIWRFSPNLPGMVVMAAADEAELVQMVATAAAHNSGPIAFRYPRGEGVGVEMPVKGEPLEIGKGRILREGARVALLSFGTHLSRSS